VPDYDMVPTVELFVELPTFTRTFGGYRPEAVDEALTEISKQLDAERDRAVHAQQRLMEAEAVLETLKGPATFDHLAAAANKILAEAGRNATEVVRQADLRVRELLLNADAAAAEVIAEAERRCAEPNAQAAELREAVERRRSEAMAEAERMVQPIRDAAKAEAALVAQEAFEAVELLMGEILARRDAVAMDVSELEERRRRTVERLELSQRELAATAARVRAEPPEEGATPTADDIQEDFQRVFGGDGRAEAPGDQDTGDGRAESPRHQDTGDETPDRPAGAQAERAPTGDSPADRGPDTADSAVAAALGDQPGDGGDPWAAPDGPRPAERQATTTRRRVRPSEAPRRGPASPRA
jgi:hypothetical protein